VHRIATILTKDSRKSEVDFGVDEIDPNAVARATREWDKVSIQTRIIDPPLRSEFHGISEIDGRIVDQRPIVEIGAKPMLSRILCPYGDLSSWHCKPVSRPWQCVTAVC
jgi:hypothetical protein